MELPVPGFFELILLEIIIDTLIQGPEEIHGILS
jgi:hypothetical protein